MRIDQLRQEEVQRRPIIATEDANVCTGGVIDAELCTFDDEDFWEGVDLLETARKQMEWMLKYGVSPTRRHLMNNLCDDITQFIGMFIEVEAEVVNDKVGWKNED